MMMKRLLALFVAGLVGSLGGAAMANNVAMTSSAPVNPSRREQRFESGTGYYSGNSYRRGPGWTFAQVKRMATKRRNQIKARRAKR